eukprot:424283-Hanusia_phi.AAC.1
MWVDVIQVVARGMADHVRGSVQQQGINFFKGLADALRTQTRLWVAVKEAKGIETMIDLMITHRRVDGVQECGCEFLEAMASDGQGIGMKIVQSHKGFAEIARSMRIHHDTPTVIEAGCRFFCSAFAEHSLAKLRKINVHQVVIDGMKHRPKSQGIQQHGCGALANLASKGDIFQERIMEGRGIEAVIAGLEEHRRSAG